MPTELNPGVGPSGSGRETKTKFAYGWICLVTALGVIASIALYLVVVRAEEKRDQAEFERQHDRYLYALNGQRNSTEDVLRILRSLFHQNRELHRELFTNTVWELSIRLKGVQAICWAPRVKQANRKNFQEMVQKEGFPNFQIREGDLVHALETLPEVAGERPEYFPLRFIDPMVGNQIVLGYDLDSVPEVHDLLNKSRQLGEALISAPVLVPYGGGVQKGVLAAIPVFYPEYMPRPEARLDQLEGYVVGVVIVDELMKVIEELNPDLRLDVEFWDITPGQEEILNIRVGRKQLDRSNAKELAELRSRTPSEKDLPIGGRQLRLIFRRSLNWERGFASWAPAAVLGVGLLLTGILTQFMVASGARADRIEAVVHLRTTELAQANAQLRDEARERIEAQNQLACERNLLYLLLNQLPDVVYVTDRQGKRIISNDAYTRVIQEQSAASQENDAKPTESSIFATALSSGLTNVLLSGKPILNEAMEVPGADGAKHFEVSKLPFRDAKGEIDGLLIIARDVTELKRADMEKLEFARRLQETQKLESLGILAGGIAHDFNNLLTTILGNANLARGDLSEGTLARKCLQRIEAASVRAANLCKQMLAYSGKGHFIIRRLDLSLLVEQTIELLRLSIQKKATLTLKLTPQLPPVKADATQLQQILMNLVINAADAVGERGGVIRITTGLMRVDQSALSQLSVVTDIAPGEYVFLEVSDDGCGMSAETKARVFDPFFTTKFTGRGLGLAAVLGIVRGHHGAISVESELGKGTTFKLLLPKTEGPVDALEVTHAPKDGWVCKGNLLLVDDEEEVRSVTSLMLERAGFTLDLANDGQQAVEKFQAHPNRYQAVLLDLTMPRLDGVETLRELRRIRSDTRVLMMSGFSSKEATERFVANGPNGFIQKPFLPKELLEALRAVLEEKPGSSQPDVTRA